MCRGAMEGSCKRALFTAVLLLFAAAAAALEIHRLEVSRDGARFLVRAESTMNAPAGFIYAILMDYDNFHRLADGITETRMLPPDEDGTLLGYTRIDSCVWFFCRRIERVERVYPNPGRTVATEVLPAYSDFELYETRWALEPAPGGTRVHFEAAMDPDFWIPPLIGPWAVRRKLEASAEELGVRIEYLYRNGLQLTDLPADAGPPGDDGAD